MRRDRSGFTLLELLVVIALIVAMTTMAIGAFGAFLSSKQIQLAGRTVTNACGAARQFAVSNRLPCLVQLVDADVDGDPDTVKDALLVIPFDAVLNRQTGELQHVVSVDPPIFRKELPGKVEFFVLTPPLNSVVSDKFRWHLDANNDDDWDPLPATVRGFIFYPDGTSWTVKQDPTVGPDNTIILWDPVSHEKAKIYCHPVTGYTKEIYDE